FPMFVVQDCVDDEHKPMDRAVLYNNVGDQAFIDMWRQALDNTIFWQLETANNPDFSFPTPPGEDPPRCCDGRGCSLVPPNPLGRLPDRLKGIVRSSAAHLIDLQPDPHHNSDDDGKITQQEALVRHDNILMTDYPVNFIADFQGDDPLASPTRA